MVPEGWAAARTRAEIQGWNVESILETSKSNWPRLVRSLQGTKPLAGKDDGALTSHQDLIEHNIRMSYAYVLALASRNASKLSLLDWGGGIGHFNLLSRVLVPDLEIDYHCKDLPLLADYGRSLFPEATFHTEESCLDRSYDLVLASASLHYWEKWQTALAGLTRATGKYLYVTQLPVVRRSPSFVYVQRPYRFGYETEYLSWCFNREEFLDAATSTGMKLQREFIVGHQPSIRNAPERCEYWGFLFRSNHLSPEA
jgi:putative methyltransferase (TIGR04325 family)